MSLDPTDVDLVFRARAGDRAAFGVLVERYQDDLYRYVRHMGFAEADGRDILQDGFVRAYRHLGRCGDPERFDGWLFRIVANLCRTRGARNGRRKIYSLHDLPLRSDGPTPDRAAEAVVRSEQVSAALAELPSDQREAVVLFYLEGYPVREIAEVAGASESAVKMRLKRARERLRDLLSPYLVEIP